MCVCKLICVCVHVCKIRVHRKSARNLNDIHRCLGAISKTNIDDVRSQGSNDHRYSPGSCYVTSPVLDSRGTEENKTNHGCLGAYILRKAGKQ